jgi:RNA polymerase sigma factor (sigma-70 family)
MDDAGLVIAVRQGDDRAFEALYCRYHRRIAAYVLKTVKDHGRAEDVTQEVFLSALRRMRSTERPIAFEPWIYAIARNACIDEFRRAQRREAPVDVGENGALVDRMPTPDAALVTKLELDDLRGAFGGLSDHHHEALVLRELDGFSHREIGERMGLSRAAVESTLSRARRRLVQEYEEIATGARCRQIQRIIARAAGTTVGTREAHRLARHVSHCQPCRREALGAGIDPALLADVPPRRRRLAGLLPFPAIARLFRLGGGGDGGFAAPALSEPLHAGWAKAAAVVAVVVAGAGATGVGTEVVGDRAPASAAERSHRTAAAPVGSGGADAARVDVGERAAPAGARPPGAGKREGPARRDRGSSGVRRRAPRAGSSPGTGSSPGAGSAPSAGEAPVAGGAPSGAGAEDARDAGGGEGQDGGDGDGGAPATDAPAGDTPPPPRTVATGVDTTLGAVDQTVRGVTEGVGETLDGVGQTLRGSPQGLGETVQGVDQTVGGVTDGLGGATRGVEETLDGVLGGLLGPRR